MVGGVVPICVERVDHVLGVGLRHLQRGGPAAAGVRHRRQRLGDEVRRRQPPEDVGDVQEVALAQGVVDGQVAHGGADERVDGEGVGDGRVDFGQHGAEEGVLALNAAEVRQAVVLPVAVRVLVVEVPAAHELQRGGPVHDLAARRGHVEPGVLVLDGGREVHGDAAQRVDHAREPGEVHGDVVVDGDPEVLLNGLDQQVGPAVVGGIDAVHARDPAVVAGDVDPEVARDGEHRDRLGRGVEAGHHGHVAALAAGVGLVAEGLDLRGVRDEGARVRAHQEQVERFARRGGRGDQMLGVDLLDLV